MRGDFSRMKEVSARTKSQPKIALITAAWGRAELFSFFCRYWAEMAELFPLSLYCAVSELSTLEIARENNFNIVEADNQPLFRKWNAVVKRAEKDRPDYCLFMGSDDIMNVTLLEYYMELMAVKPDYIAPYDWYFYDCRSRNGLYWGGYREQYRYGEPCGAGRMLSAEMLDAIKWQPWLPGYDKGLDTGFTNNIKNIFTTNVFFHIKCRENMCALDIKTRNNMTPFRQWDNSTMMRGDKMLEEFFGRTTAQQILKLKA